MSRIDELLKNEEVEWKKLGEVCEIKTGKLNANAKVEALRTWATNLGIDREQTVVVGDGANDISMIKFAGLGVAFCAKPTVQAATPYCILTRDLSAVLRFLNAN